MSGDLLCTKCGQEPRDPGQRWGKQCRADSRARTRKPQPPAGTPEPPEVVAKRAKREKKRRETNAQKKWQETGVPPTTPDISAGTVPVHGDAMLAAQILYNAGPYDAAIADTVLSLMAAGYSLNRACRHVHVGRNSILAWVRDNTEDMAERYASARMALVDHWADEIIDIADDGRNDTYTDDEGRSHVDTDVIQRSKLRVESRLRMIAKLRPEVYGDKVEVKGGQTQSVYVIALNNPTRDPLARPDAARVIEASLQATQTDEAILDFRGLLDRPRGNGNGNGHP